MHAQAARFGHWIDQPGKRCSAGQGVVIAFGVAAGRDVGGGQPFQAGCDGLGMQSGAVHDTAGEEFHGFVAADLQQDAAVCQHLA